MRYKVVFEKPGSLSAYTATSKKKAQELAAKKKSAHPDATQRILTEKEYKELEKVKTGIDKGEGIEAKEEQLKRRQEQLKQKIQKAKKLRQEHKQLEEEYKQIQKQREELAKRGSQLSQKLSFLQRGGGNLQAKKVREKLGRMQERQTKLQKKSKKVVSGAEEIRGKYKDVAGDIREGGEELKSIGKGLTKAQKQRQEKLQKLSKKYYPSQEMMQYMGEGRAAMYPEQRQKLLTEKYKIGVPERPDIPELPKTDIKEIQKSGQEVQKLQETKTGARDVPVSEIAAKQGAESYGVYYGLKSQQYERALEAYNEAVQRYKQRYQDKKLSQSKYQEAQKAYESLQKQAEVLESEAKKLGKSEKRLQKLRKEEFTSQLEEEGVPETEAEEAWEKVKGGKYEAQITKPTLSNLQTLKDIGPGYKVDIGKLSRWKGHPAKEGVRGIEAEPVIKPTDITKPTLTTEKKGWLGKRLAYWGGVAEGGARALEEAGVTPFAREHIIGKPELVQQRFGTISEHMGEVQKFHEERVTKPVMEFVGSDKGKFIPSPAFWVGRGEVSESEYQRRKEELKTKREEYSNLMEEYKKKGYIAGNRFIGPEREHRKLNRLYQDIQSLEKQVEQKRGKLSPVKSFTSGVVGAGTLIPMFPAFTVQAISGAVSEPEKIASGAVAFGAGTARYAKERPFQFGGYLATLTGPYAVGKIRRPTLNIRQKVSRVKPRERITNMMYESKIKRFKPSQAELQAEATRALGARERVRLGVSARRVSGKLPKQPSQLKPSKAIRTVGETTRLTSATKLTADVLRRRINYLSSQRQPYVPGEGLRSMRDIISRRGEVAGLRKSARITSDVLKRRQRTLRGDETRDWFEGDITPATQRGGQPPRGGGISRSAISRATRKLKYEEKFRRAQQTKDWFAGKETKKPKPEPKTGKGQQTVLQQQRERLGLTKEELQKQDGTKPTYYSQKQIQEMAKKMREMTKRQQTKGWYRQKKPKQQPKETKGEQKTIQVQREQKQKEYTKQQFEKQDTTKPTYYTREQIKKLAKLREKTSGKTGTRTKTKTMTRTGEMLKNMMLTSPYVATKVDTKQAEKIKELVGLKEREKVKEKVKEKERVKVATKVGEKEKVGVMEKFRTPAKVKTPTMVRERTAIMERQKTPQKPRRPKARPPFKPKTPPITEVTFKPPEEPPKPPTKQPPQKPGPGIKPPRILPERKKKKKDERDEQYFKRFYEISPVAKPSEMIKGLWEGKYYGR